MLHDGLFLCNNVVFRDINLFVVNCEQTCPQVWYVIQVGKRYLTLALW